MSLGCPEGWEEGLCHLPRVVLPLGLGNSNEQPPGGQVNLVVQGVAKQFSSVASSEPCPPTGHLRRTNLHVPGALSEITPEGGKVGMVPELTEITPQGGKVGMVPDCSSGESI